MCHYDSGGEALFCEKIATHVSLNIDLPGQIQLFQQLFSKQIFSKSLASTFLLLITGLTRFKYIPSF